MGQDPETGSGPHLKGTGPVVFHHIPKCAGTSLLELLGGGFTLVRDYRRGWAQEFGPPVDPAALDGRHCLCGHFDAPGAHLAERYPELFAGNGVRLFCFVREPLERVLSLYRWEGRTGDRRDDHLPRYVQSRAGSLAAAFGVGWDDYRSVLDRYGFIGLVEALPDEVRRLARWLGMPPPPALPRRNVTDPYGNMPHRRRLGPADIAAFERAAALDYAVYEHCRRRWQAGARGGAASNAP